MQYYFITFKFIAKNLNLHKVLLEHCLFVTASKKKPAPLLETDLLYHNKYSVLLYFTEVCYRLAVSQDAVVLFFRTHDDLFEITLTSTCRN